MAGFLQNLFSGKSTAENYHDSLDRDAARPGRKLTVEPHDDPELKGAFRLRFGRGRLRLWHPERGGKVVG